MKMGVTAGSIFKRAKENGYSGTYENSPEGQYYKELEAKRKLDAMFVKTPGNEDDKSTFITIADLFKNPPNPSYRIYGVLEDSTTAVWFGDPGSYKSFLAIKAAIALAAENQFAGRDTKPSVCIIIAGEGHAGIYRRAKAEMNRLGISPDIPLVISKTSIPLIDENAIAILEHEVKKYADFFEMSTENAVIFIDTLATNFGQGNEDSTQDMNQFITNLNQLRNRLSCTIVIIHHTGHGDKARGRGSSVLPANCDSVFRISRERDCQFCCLHSPTKMKDGEPPPDLWFESNVVRVGFDEKEQPITTLVLEHIPDFTRPIKMDNLGVNEKFIVDSIPENGIEPETMRATFEKWKGDKFDRRPYLRTLNRLKDKGVIDEKDNLLIKTC